MADLPIPEFLSSDAAAIRADVIAYYEGLVGRTIYPAEVESFLFDALVYREVIYRNDVNSGALQNLAAFSTFPVLDYLAQNVGISNRLPSQSATTNLFFTLSPGHPNMVIQSGTRVSHPNGNPVFSVIDDTLVLSGTDTVTILAEAVDPGSAANGFEINTINVLIDSFVDFVSVTNSNVTSGGSEEETDEQLRERIYLAPSAFAVAGPIDAYKFHTFSAHPSIIDVSVQGPEIGVPYPGAGTVVIYPLTDVVPTPSAVLDAVRAKFAAENIHPTTDTVEVVAPTQIDYIIDVALTLYNGADDESILAVVTDALNLYTETKGSKLGLDIVRTQIGELCMVDGVYDYVLTNPAANIDVPKSSFGNCTAVNITIAGYTNG